MSEVVDISPKLRDYLIASAGIYALTGKKIYAGQIPPDKSGSEVKKVSNSKVGFRQNGGDPKGMNYRYTFICRANTLKDARALAILVANRLTNENFSLESVGGENLAYWAELEGSLSDSSDEITGLPEVFFNINIESLH